MALLTEIKARIVSLSITGYGASNIFRGEMPATPDKVVCLHQYPGNPPELGFGRAGLQYVSPGLQVTVRGCATDFDGPLAVITTIFNDLPKVQDAVLGSTSYLLITANQTPFLLARDGNQRCVWAVNFICATEVPA